MQIYLSTITLNSANMGSDNPLPYFRERKQDRDLLDLGLTEKEKQGLGYQTGYRVLPCSVQDGYSIEKSPRDLKVVVMENDCLKAIFLCEYGARLYSLFDKKRNKELLYVNPVFRPCNLAVRNAWFSGGIEWNVGQYGHSSLTCEPFNFALCNEGGETFLRAFEYERIKGVLLQMDFHLPDGSNHLLAHIKITNIHKTKTSLYWWTNTAVSLSKRARVFSGTDEVISTLPKSASVNGFLHDKLPSLKVLPNKDSTYPQDFDIAAEYFFQNEKKMEQTFECVGYEDGIAFYERSTVDLPYRKMFVWSNRQGGKHWQEILSVQGGEHYLEVQAGIAPTQVHGAHLEGNSSYCFTQAFGGMDTDANITHTNNWHEGRNYVYEKIEDRISAKQINTLHEQYQKQSNCPITELLHIGTGWGALEEIRENNIMPKSVHFEKSSLNQEHAPWIELAEKGTMPEFENGLPSSFQVDNNWLKLLEDAAKGECSNAVKFHLAIAKYESSLWEQGMEIMEDLCKNSNLPIYPRTLAMMYKQDGQMEKACEYMQKAIDNGGTEQSLAFAQDYLDILLAQEKYQIAWDFYNNLSSEQKANERLRLMISNAAFNLKMWDFLEIQFATEFISMREGEHNLVHLWYQKEALQLAERENLKLTEAKKRVNSLEPPYAIDLRLFPKEE